MTSNTMTSRSKEEDPFSLIERSIAVRSPETKSKTRASVTKRTKQSKNDTIASAPELASFFQATTGLAKTKSSSRITSNETNHNNKSTPCSATARASSSSSPSDLSELAKQLRLLQTKNDAQVIQISRLERQLQIMADLQNSSVTDLSQALQSACVAHVPTELQATLASLRNQLQLAQLQLQQAQQELPNNATAASRRMELADLQLRIGELEEVEDQQRKELSVVYHDLREQSASWIRLKAQYEEQQTLLEEYRRKEKMALAAVDDDEDHIGDYVEVEKIDDDGNETVEEEEEVEMENDDDMQEEEQRLAVSEQLLRDELELASNFGGFLSSPRESAIVEQQVEQGQLAILQKQWEEAEKAYKLKQAQIKARNFVLEEHVQDLEQQLSSLYTAFNITSHDLDQEQQARRAIESNLHAADERVAQYIDDETAENASTASTPIQPSAPMSPNVAPASPVRVSPTMPRPYPPGFSGSSSPSRLSAPLPTSPPRTAYSPSVSTPPKGELLLEGHLLFRMTGLRKTWKEKYVALYLSSTHFHLMIANVGDRLHVKTYSAAAGSAEIQLYHKQPYGFTFMIAPSELSGTTVLYLAATNEADFIKWTTALGSVSSHPDDGRDNRLNESTTSGPTNNDDAESQEAADLERALWLSTLEQDGVGYGHTCAAQRDERTDMVFS